MPALLITCRFDMAIDFNNQESLGRLNDIFNNPTGWGSGVIAALTAALGANNPFNSTALADTGDAEGNVPVLDAEGIQEQHLPPATTSTDGAVRISPGSTTNAISDGFPLVLLVAEVLSLLNVSPRFGLFSDGRVISATRLDPRRPNFFISLPTSAGISLISGGVSRRFVSSTTVTGRQYVAPNGVVTNPPQISILNTPISVPDSDAKRGDNVRLLTDTERGDVFRWGLYLPGFGRYERTGKSDMVLAFKEVTPSFFRFRFQHDDTSGRSSDFGSFIFLSL